MLPFRYLALVLLVTCVIGCSNLKLASKPTTAVPLSGVWLIDATASDDIAGAMRPGQATAG